MKVSLSRTKIDKSADEIAGILSEWIGPDAAGGQAQEGDPESGRYSASEERSPIEPKGLRWKGSGILKWVLFLLIIGYAVISYYHVPILTALGNYLVLDNPLKKADLIVCTPGPPLEQILTAADLYRRGLAHRIFIPREIPPPGLDTLREQGGRYPETSDLFMETLERLNVPKSACVLSDRVVDGIWAEAEELLEWVQGKEIRSMILVAPPYRARRTYRIFRYVLDGKEMEFMVSPSIYSSFQADAWWQEDRFRSEVVLEYQKLAYYAVRGIW
jgi:uncharacterized SAM-binding protein YcdF (DUF218 family)